MVIAAIAVSACVACTNCSSTGWVEIPCPKCSGSGLVVSTRAVNGLSLPRSAPCTACCKGLVTKDSKGTGKKRVTCKVCKGQKMIKKKSTTTR